MLQVLLEDGMIVLMDDCLGVDAEDITTLGAAMATVERWGREYGLDVAAAKRTVKKMWMLW